MSTFSIITIYSLGIIQGILISIAVIFFEEKKQSGESGE